MHPATATRSEAPPLDDPGPQQLEPVPQKYFTGDPQGMMPAAAVVETRHARHYDPRTAPEFTPFACSEEIDQLTAALSTAQRAFDAVQKNKVAVVESRREGARSYRYNYADLNEVISATRPHLSENGLVLLQMPIVRQRTVTVLGLLTHASGQWIRTDLPMTIESLDPQSIGTAFSYGRRYQQLGLFNLAPGDGEDNDGANHQTRPAASAVQMPQRAESAPPTPRGPAPTPPTASPASRPGPVPVTTPGLSFVTVTAVDERKTSTGKKYWVAAFSDGRVGCTFSTTMEARLVEARDYQTRFSRVTLSTKGNWTYIDVLEV